MAHTLSFFTVKRLRRNVRNLATGNIEFLYNKWGKIDQDMYPTIILLIRTNLTISNGMDPTNDQILFDVFHMLMERTTKLEKTIDQAMVHSQLNTIGSLNTTLLELPYKVYVHEPLNKIYMGLDDYAAFYIETDVEFPFDSLLKQIAAGVFDDAFGSGKELLKRDIRDEMIGEKCDVLITKCCDLTTVHSKRCRLREHVIDLIVEKYMANLHNNGKSPIDLHYDPINHMTSFFVFVKDTSSWTQFSFLKDLTSHVQKITRNIDPEETIKSMTICPLTKLEASTLMEGHDIMDAQRTKPLALSLHLDRLAKTMRHHLFWRTVSPFV